MDDKKILVVTRREKQSIYLIFKDEVIKLFITKIRGNQTRIGIKASQNVEISRGEIFEALEEIKE